MRHKFLVLPVKKWLKSVHIYGSYRKIKTGVPIFFGTPGSCVRRHLIARHLIGNFDKNSTNTVNTLTNYD